MVKPEEKIPSSTVPMPAKFHVLIDTCVWLDLAKDYHKRPLLGLLSVHAICIHAHLPPEFLFSHAPTLKSVTPETGCVFCRWQEDRGFMEGCATACSASASVGPEQVMAELERIQSEGQTASSGGAPIGRKGRAAETQKPSNRAPLLNYD